MSLMVLKEPDGMTTDYQNFSKSGTFGPNPIWSIVFIYDVSNHSKQVKDFKAKI